MPEAFIFDHVRSPRGRGKTDGSLHEVTALNLAVQTIAAVKDRTNLTLHLSMTSCLAASIRSAKQAEILRAPPRWWPG